MPTEPAMTVEEIAQALRCSKTHVRNLLHGRVTNVPPLPCVKVGKHYVVRRASFERWLEAVESTQAA